MQLDPFSRGAYSVALTENGASYVQGDFSKIFLEGNQEANYRKESIGKTLEELEAFCNSQRAIEQSIRKMLAENGTSLEEILANRAKISSLKEQEQQTKEIEQLQQLLTTFDWTFSNNKVLTQDLRVALNKYYQATHLAAKTAAKFNQEGMSLEEAKALLSETAKSKEVVEIISNEMFDAIDHFDDTSPKEEEEKARLIGRLRNLYLSMMNTHPITVTINDSNGGIDIVAKDGEGQTKSFSAVKQAIEEFVTEIEKDYKNSKTDRQRQKIINYNKTRKGLRSKDSKSVGGRLGYLHDQLEAALASYYKELEHGGKITDNDFMQLGGEAIRNLVKSMIIKGGGEETGKLKIDSHELKTGTRKAASEVGYVTEYVFSSKISKQQLQQLMIDTFHFGEATTTIGVNMKPENVTFNPKDIPSGLREQLGKDALIEAAEIYLKEKANPLVETESKNVSSKIDDYLTLSNSSTGTHYFIAFSDKTIQSLSNQGFSDISFHGSASDQKTMLNSLHLLKSEMDAIQSDNLLFAMLNSADVSIYSNSNFAKEIEKYIQNLIISNFYQISFDPQTFFRLVDGSSNENTLFVHSLTGMLVPAYKSVENIIKAIKAKNLLQSYVKVSFTPATLGISSSAMYIASVQQVPFGEDRSARWDFVANQVAAQTQLSVAFNAIQYMNTMLGI